MNVIDVIFLCTLFLGDMSMLVALILLIFNRKKKPTIQTLAALGFQIGMIGFACAAILSFCGIMDVYMHDRKAIENMLSRSFVANMFLLIAPVLGYICCRKEFYDTEYTPHHSRS